MLPRFLEYVQFKGHSAISKAIQFWTRSPYSHSAVLDREANSNKILIEQWPHSGGVTSWMDYNYFSPLGQHAIGTEYEIWSLEVKSHQYDAVMEYYRYSAQIQKPYDWSGIVDFIIKGEGEPEKTFCSEEMAIPVVKELGWKTVNPAVVSPGIWTMLLEAVGAKMTQAGSI